MKKVRSSDVYLLSTSKQRRFYRCNEIIESERKKQLQKIMLNLVENMKDGP